MARTHHRSALPGVQRSASSGPCRHHQVPCFSAGDQVRSGLKEEVTLRSSPLCCQSAVGWSSKFFQRLHLPSTSPTLPRVRTASDCIMRMETKEVTQLRDVDSAFNQLLKPALASIKVWAGG